MQGTPTAHLSDPKFWNYQVKYDVQMRRIAMKTFGPWVPAENFSAIAENRAPPDPK